MASGEMHQNIGDIMRTASECAKGGEPVLIPWRIEANQDRLHQGLTLCGCAFTPDEPDDDVRR